MQLIPSLVTVFLLLVKGISDVDGFYSKISINTFPKTRILSSEAKASTTSVENLVDYALLWVKEETLESILPKTMVANIVTEIYSNASFWDESRVEFDRIWKEFDAKIRNEKRTLGEIIGPETKQRILQSAEKIDIYDPFTVEAFLMSPAIEKMVGGILYEGIFEFIQRVDIIGGIVNRLPVIGPIRQQIVSEFKKNLDQALGGQVKTFLASFNRIAVQRMISFVLSPENRQSFMKANSNLINSLLSRPASALLPSSAASEKLRGELWSVVRGVPQSELMNVIDLSYKTLEDKRVNDLIDIDRVVALVPSSKLAAVNLISRFLEAHEGRISLSVDQP